MEARVDEIADRVYRISTLVDDVAPGGFSFNQFLVDAPEPMLFHTGMRQLFPLVREAIERVMPVDRLRWISFAHVEADECGAMNEFLALAPQAQVAHSGLGCMVSVNDLADRPPRPLGDGDVLELGGGPTGQRVLEIATPHVPHNWESHLLFEQQSATLFAGDLFTQLGDGPAITEGDIIEASIQAEEIFRSTSLGQAVPATLRRLADLEPRTLAVMHGSSFRGDGGALLRSLADVYEQRFACGPVPSAITAS
jgi:flavorubredoxin